MSDFQELKDIIKGGPGSGPQGGGMKKNKPIKFSKKFKAEFRKESKRRQKRFPVFTGALGAMVGALAGGGKGAIVGGVIGAMAGGAVILDDKNTLTPEMLAEDFNMGKREILDFYKPKKKKAKNKEFNDMSEIEKADEANQSEELTKFEKDVIEAFFVYAEGVQSSLEKLAALGKEAGNEKMFALPGKAMIVHGKRIYSMITKIMDKEAPAEKSVEDEIEKAFEEAMNDVEFIEDEENSESSEKTTDEELVFKGTLFRE